MDESEKNSYIIVSIPINARMTVTKEAAKNDIRVAGCCNSNDRRNSETNTKT